MLPMPHRSPVRRMSATLAVSAASAAFLLAQTPDSLAYPINTSRPVVTGKLAVGQTLTATTGTWTDSTASPIARYEYQWRGCVDVEYCVIALQGEGDHLTIPAEVEGDQIALTVIAYDEEGKMGIGTAEETAPIPYTTTRYIVSEQVSGSGSVTGAADEQTGWLEALNLDCPGSCGEISYASGTSIELTAHPDSGASFVGWGGACLGVALTCSFIVSDNETVTASFTAASPPSGGPFVLPEGKEADEPGESGWPATGGAATGSDGVLGEREEAPALSVAHPPARLLGLHALHGHHLQAVVVCQQARACHLTLAVFSEAPNARLIASRSVVADQRRRTNIALTLDRAGVRLLARRRRLPATARLMLKVEGHWVSAGQAHLALTR